MILKNGDAWCFLEMRVLEPDFEMRYFLIIFTNFDIEFPWNFPPPRAVKTKNKEAKNILLKSFLKNQFPDGSPKSINVRKI